ncbi:MAG: helix-turn-helix domain-containing protein [bacterium]
MNELKNKNDKGWFKLDRSIVDNVAKHLHPLVFSMFVVLRRYSNDFTDEVFPSHEKIAELLGITRKSVQRNIHILEDFGLIRKQKYRHNGKWAGYKYYFLDDWKDIQWDKLSHSVHAKSTKRDSGTNKTEQWDNCDP